MKSGYPWGKDKTVTEGGPMASTDPETIVKEAKTIAVVGASNDPEKYSNEVTGYLKEQGYRIVPVNPTEDEVLGEQAYETVDQIPEEVDVVDVFLPPDKTPDIAEEAVKAGAMVAGRYRKRGGSPDSRRRSAHLRRGQVYEANA
jgi:predicted CoA-binding protein